MGDRRSGVPLPASGSRSNQAQGQQGYRGERTDDVRDENAALRHAIDTDAGTLVVEEGSGTAYAEATGAAGQPIEQAGGSNRAAVPSALVLIIAAAAIVSAGAILWRAAQRDRRGSRESARAPGAAFDAPVADRGSFNHTRDAGPAFMRDPEGERWEEVDQGSDESFPASDPPSYSLPRSAPSTGAGPVPTTETTIMADKQPMQADGAGTRMRMPDENGELTSRRGEGQQGESQGGPYPNPHSGKGGSAHGPDHFSGHGGQTEQAYHGTGQLGEQKTGEQPNAGSRER